MDEVEKAIAALRNEIVEINGGRARAELVAWTLIINLEKSDGSEQSFAAIREYAANEARPYLDRKSKP